jgi:hypothetical protein
MFCRVRLPSFTFVPIRATFGFMFGHKGRIDDHSNPTGG